MNDRPELAITPAEEAEVDAANSSGRRTVVLVHGLWAIAESWQPWRELLEARGFATVALRWPGEPLTMDDALANPEKFAGVGVQDVTDHAANVLSALDRRPGVVGHSFGGLITHKIAGMGLAAASVGISPAPFRGAFGLRWSVVRGGAPVLMNPLNFGRAVRLSYAQFRYSWSNRVDEAEARELWRPGTSRAPADRSSRRWRGRPCRSGRLPPTGGTRTAARCCSSAAERTTVPLGVVRAEYARQRTNPHPTELVTVQDRGHSLTIDHGWPEIAGLTTDFLEKNLRLVPTSQPQR